MPIITIDTHGGWCRNRPELLAAVRRVAATALALPETAFSMLWNERDESDLLVRPGEDGPKALVSIALFTGRSLPVKQRLMRAISKVMEQAGIPSHGIIMHLSETLPENWLVHGALLV